MTGSTPGLAPNESVELLGPGGQQLTVDLFPTLVGVRIETDGGGIGYAAGVPGTKFTRSLIINRTSAFSPDGVAITLDSPGVSAGSGAAATANWTLTLSHDVAPERLKLVFATGNGNTHKVNVQVEVDIQETAAAPA
jgi:hypothetical protein